jgi:hypothetical protein
MTLTAAEKQCKALRGEIYRDRCEGKCQDAACVAACRGCPEGRRGRCDALHLPARKLRTFRNYCAGLAHRNPVRSSRVASV